MLTDTISGYYHGDIKDENILVDQNCNVVLVDFGGAGRVSPVAKYFMGTVDYASPEVFSGRQFDSLASEMWALGCLLYVLVSGVVP